MFEMNKILCIGAAHVDRKAKAQSDIQLGTSIPVSVSTSPGGVARNVAENLARLQCPVALVSRVGNDTEGTEVLSVCKSLSIDISMISRSITCPTASYTALLDPKGDMVVALANMDIYEEMTPSILEPFMPEMKKFPLCFLDTNLPVKTLEFLLESSGYSGIVFVDPVSVAKAKKLQGLLKYIDYIFPSRDEAEALSGVTIRTSADAESAGKKICQLGAKHTVITLGAGGVCVVNSISYGHIPPLTADSVCDVTGAGDALIAGVIYGISHSLTLDDAIHYGMAAASLTLETNHTVSPYLTQQLLNKKLKENNRCPLPIQN